MLGTAIPATRLMANWRQTKVLSPQFMVNGPLTGIGLSPAVKTMDLQMKKLMIALFTVVAAISVVGCAGKGKTPPVHYNG
jgi:hypothetical protein